MSNKRTSRDRSSDYPRPGDRRKAELLEITTIPLLKDLKKYLSHLHAKLEVIQYTCR